MSEHLSKETTARLLSRQLPPDELVAMSRHLALCPECRQQLDAGKVSSGAASLVNDLQAPARADDLHLKYEQLEGYVDELLPQADRQQVSKHLETCDNCAREVKELTSLRENLFSYPQVTPVASRAPVPRGGTFFQTFAALFALRRWQFVGAAAVLVLAGLIGWLLWQTGKQPQLANLNKNAQTKAPDDSSPQSNTALVNSPDEAQREPVKEDPAKSVYDSIVATAIARQTLTATPDLKDLNGKPVTLLGENDSAQKFDLLSPRGTVVLSSRPTLRWRALAGAASYKVYLLNAKFDVVQNSGLLRSTSWTVARPLDHGQTYIWQVVASKEGKEITSPVAPAKEARFRVLDSKSEQAVQRFVQDNHDNHLALGIVYAHHGLLDEAARELSLAEKSKQSSELARMFLRDVRAMRR